MNNGERRKQDPERALSVCMHSFACTHVDLALVVNHAVRKLKVNRVFSEAIAGIDPSLLVLSLLRHLIRFITPMMVIWRTTVVRAVGDVRLAAVA